MELPFDPAISLLGIYPRNPKTLIQNNKTTPMFIAALFTIGKIWKEPMCPSVDEWIKQLWYIFLHNGVLPGHKKRRKFYPCDSMDGPGEHYAK